MTSMHYFVFATDGSSMLKSKRVEALYQAIDVARELAREFPDAMVAAYCPPGAEELGNVDGMTRNERDDIEEAVERGRTEARASAAHVVCVHTGKRLPGRPGVAAYVLGRERSILARQVGDEWSYVDSFPSDQIGVRGARAVRIEAA